MSDEVLQEVFIPPKQAKAFLIKQGQSFRVTDIEGKQVGDLVMINEHDHSEKINPSYTRQWVSTWDPDNMLVRSMFQGITVGNQIISTVRNVMATITADTPEPSGIHDLLMRSCSRWIYEEAAQAGMGSPQDGCLELLAGALAPYGFALGDVPDDFNLFMNVQYDAIEAMFVIREPVSKPGDYIEFKAEMDLLCALSACPDDVCSQCNGKAPHPAKPLQVQIFA
jgi:uncharacterized protein YcgI (DUF1989 family)